MFTRKYHRFFYDCMQSSKLYTQQCAPGNTYRTFQKHSYMQFQCSSQCSFKVLVVAPFYFSRSDEGLNTRRLTSDPIGINISKMTRTTRRSMASTFYVVKIIRNVQSEQCTVSSATTLGAPPRVGCTLVRTLRSICQVYKRVLSSNSRVGI